MLFKGYVRTANLKRKMNHQMWLSKTRWRAAKLAADRGAANLQGSSDKTSLDRTTFKWRTQ